MLERLDPALTRALQPAIRRLDRADPNVVTWIGTAVGLGAAALFAVAGAEEPALLVAGAAAIGVSYVLDVLDGAVARAHGRTSPYGDFLDHSLDRVVNVALMLALAYNAAWVPDPQLGWWALLGVLLASYMGAQGQSSGLKRNIGGFGRSDRLATLAVGAVTAAALGGAGTWVNGITVALAVSGAGGGATFVLRGLDARRQLKNRVTPPPP